MIVWDYKKMEIVSSHEQHKVRVEGLVFSQDEKFAISIGGRDCGCVIVWNIHEQQVVSAIQVNLIVIVQYYVTICASRFCFNSKQ